VGGLGQYSIPFRGLKEGKHQFHFDIDDAFFDHFESSEIGRGELMARIDLDKHSQFLELHFFISGTVQVTCDRCLEEFPLEIQHQARLYIRFGEETLEQTDEVQILADSENEVRLEQYLYEFIHLALPYQKFHPEKEGVRSCNPEMKKVLASLSSEDSKNKEIDPRWDKLKEI
jgi:uncharacterized protein